ncbi:MAG TPA: 6-phosphofructokinase, partial [Candidatus Avacidaminococcus intestinavium]|nr:6-phosphofructokinase [Candidatus Avacidaminococcus intestinavium]
MSKKKIAVLTGGGDCPGLNAVIRAVVKTANYQGYSIYGVENGFKGLVEGTMSELTLGCVSGILPRGGTILGTTNRDNPFRFMIGCDKSGEPLFADKRQEVLENLKKYEIET